MDFIYNELSASPPASSYEEGRQRMERFIRAFNAAQLTFIKRLKQYGQQSTRCFLRFEEPIEELVLAKDEDNKYTIYSWMQDNLVSRTLRDTFLAFKRYPYIPPEQINIEEKFMEPRFNMSSCMVCGLDCHGLGVAYIQDFPAISFASATEWENNLIPFWQQFGQEKALQISVVNIHSPECIHALIVDECLWRHVPVEPMETTISANDKLIHISDDHGKNILQKFAQRLCTSPYITEIRGSLPFHANCTEFIYETRANGEIEIVLHWTDRGIGLLVQTTGRNIHETKEIAKRLAEKFNR